MSGRAFGTPGAYLIPHVGANGSSAIRTLLRAVTLRADQWGVNRMANGVDVRNVAAHEYFVYGMMCSA